MNWYLYPPRLKEYDFLIGTFYISHIDVTGIDSMATALTLTLLLVAVGGYLFYRNRSPASRASAAEESCAAQPPVSRKRADSNFRSLGIDAAVNCCQRAKNAAGQRYLIGLAPKLPIAGCNAEQCNCKYIHFADRRGGYGNRRSLGSMKKNLTESGDRGERRNLKGRRRTDT